MAAFAVTRGTSGLLHGLRASFRGFAQVKSGNVAAAAVAPTSQRRDCRWYCVSNLSVRERIDTKRRAALVGGGQSRIDAQHKRVTQNFSLVPGHKFRTYGCFLGCRVSAQPTKCLPTRVWLWSSEAISLTNVARHMSFTHAHTVLTAACFEA